MTGIRSMSGRPRVGIRAIVGRSALAISVVLVGQIGFAAPVAASVGPFVNSTADVATNFGACGNSAQLTSSGSLREAVCAANNFGTTPVTISVQPGTYTLTNGELQMGKVSGSNISLIGSGAASTIIDGNNAKRVFDLDPSIVGGVTTSISAVTITNGADTTFGGAGIIAGSGNVATLDSLTITNSTISNNDVNSVASNKLGGGVEFQGGSLTITNSTISGNTAGSSGGGGVAYEAERAASGEHLSITGSTFSGNSTNASVANVNVGGGALNISMTSVAVATPPTFTISNTRFINNSVTGSGTGIAHGGAIFVETGTPTITGSTFTGNSVSGGANPRGGAISVTGNTTTLHYNRFAGNTAANGSAVSIGIGSGATVDATDNWWGCNAGPGTAGCDTVAGGPTVSPRLIVTGTASPATVVGPNATSTITAALTTNSVGTAISASDLGAFAGVTVAWSDPLPSGATLGAASSGISSGSASVTYNSQASSGPGHVVATLDSGTATASVTVNRTPAISSSNTASFTVGTAGSFTVTTSGYPSPAITKTGTVPPGMTFTDNGNGTATLSGTPTAGGSYPLSLTANNGVAPNATQTLTVTVGQAPTFTSATSTTFVVGSAGSFSMTTTGTPAAAITKTGTLPSGLSFTDNGNGTATLAGTPAAGSGGAYSLSLTAANGVNPNGTQTLTVNVNQAPAVTTNPSDDSVTPGASVSFTAAASGFPTPTVQWQRSVGGGSFANIAGATSTTYTFTAASGDNGNEYRAVFTNTVSSATTTAATLTVAGAPTVTSADHATFTVSHAGSFTVTTSGFPNPTMTTSGTLPVWLSFTDNGNGTATIAGTPPAGSGGTYGFTINADNGTAPSASQIFTLAVDESPTITSADHITFSVGAAGTFTITTTAGYPTTTALSKTGTLPSGVTFVDNGDGTATLSGTPAAATGGSYPITISASATGGCAAAATQSFTLTVNQSPSITSADHATFAMGSAGSFTVTTTAGFPTPTTITKTGSLPAGVTFTDNGDGTATIAGTPTAAGAFPITITASNGASTDATQSFTLTVTKLPAISSADHTTFSIGSAGAFTVTTTAGYPTTTALSEAGALPSGVTFTDNGDGTATLAGTPAAGTAASYPLTITATNTAGHSDQAFTLTVDEAAAPVVTNVTVVLREGGEVTTAPVLVSWLAHDDVSPDSALFHELQLRRYADGAWGAWHPGGTVSGVQKLSSMLPNWREFQFRVRSRDAANHWSNWSESNTILVLRRQERNFTLSAGWTTVAMSGAMKDKVAKSSKVGATATLRFNGDGVAAVMPVSSGYGTAQICLDPGQLGQVCRTVNLSTFAPSGIRRLAAAFTGLPSGPHTLRITVVSGTVRLDGALISQPAVPAP
jgi:hypothetical protein